MPLSETWRGKQRDLLLPHTDLLSPHLIAELLQRTVPFREQLLEALTQVGNEEGMGKIGSSVGALSGEGPRKRAASLPAWRLTEASC